MTDWDQLDAMGNLARLNQAKAIAQQQAKRDATLAAQNAEVVRLLKEQQAREDADKARIEAMPKCPDCRSPVEGGSRRCPQCRSDIVAWDYEHTVYSWRMICRAAEAQQVLTDRCNLLIEKARSLRDECLGAAAAIDSGWQGQTQSALDALDALVLRYSPDARPTVQLLLHKAANGERLCTKQEQATLVKMRQQISEYDETIQTHQQTLLTLAVRARKSRKVGWHLLLVIGGAVWAAVAAFAFFARPPHVAPDFSVMNMLGGFAATLIGAVLWCVHLARLRGIDRDRERVEEMIARSRQERQMAVDAAIAKENSAHDAWVQKLTKTGVWNTLGRARKQVDQVANAYRAAKETCIGLKVVLLALSDLLDFGQKEQLLSTNAFAGLASSIRHPCINAIQSDDAASAADRLTLAKAISEERRNTTAAIQTLVKTFNELGVGLGTLQL